MPNLYKDVTKQNVTELIYKNTLINNTNVQQSKALSDLVCGIFEQTYTTAIAVKAAVQNGDITKDTYVFVNGLEFTPAYYVDTAENIVNTYL